MKKTKSDPTLDNPAPAAAAAPAPPPQAEPAADALRAEHAGQEPPPAPDTDVAELQRRIAEAGEKYLRAKAELENYRRRMQRELGDIGQAVKAATIQEFLAVYDHFQMAMVHAEQDADFTSLKQGMDMIAVEFKRTIQNLGVTVMDTVGTPFDPTLHEAIAQTPSAEVPEGHVVQQWKSGFQLGDRLLRPASVVVSTGPATAVDGQG